MNMRYYLLFISLFSIHLLNAQQQVKGNITGESEEPLIGATILIKNSGEGTITDYNGDYELTVPNPSDTLIISYTGYKSIEQVVGTREVIDFNLMPDSQLIDEVVVIGYGIQKKRVSTGAISKLSSEKLEGIQVQNVQSALEGQVSGLIVSESSGQPGSSSSILIRGISTNGDNSPLFVVDGLQVDNIDNLNPSDVESVDVLKDAASCAIYGARGANGVIIVTTKKGSDTGATLTYEAFTSQSNPWRTPEMLSSSDYIMLTREKFENGGQSSALETLGFPQSTDEVPNTNWMDQIFSQGSTNSHRLSASMKNLYLSLEYWDEKGVIGGEKSNYKRYSVRLNGSKDINKYITIGENINVNRIQNNNIGVNSAFGTLISDAFAYDPITEVFNDEKQYGFEQSKWVQKEYINPLSRLFLSNSSGHSNQFVGNVFLEIKPFKNIKFKSDLGTDFYWYQFRDFTPDFNFHPAAINVSNDISQGYGTGQSYQFENYINYTQSFGENNFDLIVGTSYRESTGEQKAGGSTSFIPNEVQFNDNFQLIDAGQDTLDLAYGTIGVKYKLFSYYGRLLYNYNDKYLFSATLRRDGSSTIGPGKRFGIFPSFSAGWVISDESFFNFRPISFLKLRASWGVNGSDRIPALAYSSTVENNFAYPFGNSLNTGSALATPANPFIAWEESVQLDVGVEVRMLNDKLSAELDFYQKSTKELLMDQQLPGFIGATNNPTSNLGEIRNTGIEAAISYKQSFGDFKFNTTLNYTTFTNEVINVAGESGFITGWSWPVRNTPITRLSEGYPVGHFVGYTTNGIFQSQEEVFSHINSDGDLLQPNAAPGDLIFVDVNNDGSINSDDIADIGSPWPDHIIGLTLGLQYKGFDINCVLSTQLGHEIFRTYERQDISYTNYQTFWLDRWTPENPSNEIPRLVSNDPNNNQRPSDFYLEDGSFLRLRNFQIGYTIPKRISNKAKFSDVRIYLSANNLFTITNYTGFDPEIGTGDWILDTGIDKGFYPSNRTIGFGIKLSM